MNLLIAAMLCLPFLITNAAACVPEPPTALDARLHDVLFEMFEAGIGSKRSTTKAQAAYEQAKRLAPKDPRVTYAWGLVQQRRLKHEEALKLLSESAEDGYFRARKPVIWYLLSKSRTQAAGLKEAVLLAKQLSVSNDPSALQQRQEMAQWLSEVLSAAGRTTGKKNITEIESTEVELRKVFDACQLGDAWAKGRVAVQQRHDAFTKSSAERSAEAAKKAEAESKNTIHKLETRMQDLKKSTKESEVNKSDLRAAVTDVLGRISAEFGRLDRDYQFLVQQDELLTREILTVLRDLTALGAFPDGNRRVNRRQTTRDVQVFRLEQDLLTLQQKQWEVRTQADGVIARANNLGAYQTRVVADFERRTGEIVNQQSRMAQWASRAKVRKKKVAESQKSAKRKPPRPKKVTFRNLLPFDVKQERDVLLHSLVPPEQKEKHE